MMTRRSGDNHGSITVMRGDIPITHKWNAKNHIDASIHNKKRSIEKEADEFIVKTNGRKYNDKVRNILSKFRHLIVWKAHKL